MTMTSHGVYSLPVFVFSRTPKFRAIALVLITMSTIITATSTSTTSTTFPWLSQSVCIPAYDMYALSGHNDSFLIVFGSMFESMLFLHHSSKDLALQPLKSAL
jgi:hypothetical protein